MVLTLTNCLASWLVVGTALETGLGVVAVLAAGLACGALNGLIVIYGRLQPIVTTIATGGDLLRPGADAAALPRRVGQRGRSPTR